MTNEIWIRCVHHFDLDDLIDYETSCGERSNVDNVIDNSISEMMRP